MTVLSELGSLVLGRALFRLTQPTARTGKGQKQEEVERTFSAACLPSQVTLKLLQMARNCFQLSGLIGAEVMLITEEMTTI